MNAFLKDFLGILKEIKEWLALAIALGGLVIAFDALARRGPAIVTLLVMALFASLSLASLVYVRLKKVAAIDAGLIVPPGATDFGVRYAYSKRIRATALAGLIALPAIGLAGFAILKYRKRTTHAIHWTNDHAASDCFDSVRSNDVCSNRHSLVPPKDTKVVPVVRAELPMA